MLFVAILQDLPGMGTARTKAAIGKHDDYLKNHSAVLVAGPLRVTSNGPIVGGLWIMDTTTREAAAALVEGDPYFVAGLRRYELFTWSKAINVKVSL